MSVIRALISFMKVPLSCPHETSSNRHVSTCECAGDTIIQTVAERVTGWIMSQLWAEPGSAI